MLVLPLDFFLFPFFSFFCPPQQLLKFLSMPFNKKTINRTNSGVQLSSKLLGRLFFFTSFFSLPSPAPGPMLSKTLFFVIVIVLLYPNIEWGDGGYLAKEKTFLRDDENGLLLSCTTFPTTFIQLGLQCVVIQRPREGAERQKKAERRESRSNLVHSISGLQVKTDWGIHQELD